MFKKVFHTNPIFEATGLLLWILMTAQAGAATYSANLSGAGDIESSGFGYSISGTYSYGMTSFSSVRDGGGLSGAAGTVWIDAGYPQFVRARAAYTVGAMCDDTSNCDVNWYHDESSAKAFAEMTYNVKPYRLDGEDINEDVTVPLIGEVVLSTGGNPQGSIFGNFGGGAQARATITDVSSGLNQNFRVDSPFNSLAEQFTINTGISGLEISLWAYAEIGIAGPAQTLAWVDFQAYADPTLIIDPSWELADEYGLIIDSDFSEGYSLQVGEAVVPIPAAFWFFGSALVSLVLIKRK